MKEIITLILLLILLSGCTVSDEKSKNSENCQVNEDSCKNLCNDYQTDKDACVTRCNDNYYLCRSNN